MGEKLRCSISFTAETLILKEQTFNSTSIFIALFQGRNKVMLELLRLQQRIWRWIVANFKYLGKINSYF